MSLFADSLRYGYDAIESVAGEEVTYLFCDDQTQASVTAVPGQKETVEQSPGGKTLVTSRTADWLIRRDALKRPPKRNDLITRADGRQYLVSAPGGGAAWDHSDTATELYYRIHTTRQ